MQPAWAQPLVIIDFILWLALAIGSWCLIRSQPDAASKTIWFRRSMIALVVLVLAAGAPFALASGDSFGAVMFFVMFVPTGVLIAWFTIATTYFCPGCGRRSRNRNIFAHTFHCPHCGHRLKPV
jgi:predicted RNA-binding Zn-ribbon protein involved in translation (DUF1610 family)